jgi:CheY-like chemotaxis protein
MRDQLLQSRKMEALGTLAGGIAHDFNNILTAILGYADLALMQIRDGQEVVSEIKSILDLGMRARDLVHRILTFSRKVKMDAKPLHLNQVVEQAIRLLERTIVRMINIKLELAEDLWPIMGDSTQLVQVLLNLGANAADAMPGGGQLQIKTVNRTMEPDHPSLYGDLPPGRYVELVVSDTGCGMDAKTLEQMFDPFYTTKGSGKGTGLGLSTVYGIVKSHQGQIICHSQPSDGTTFHVLLPAPPLVSVVDQEPDGPTEAPMGEGETILVVDDEPPVREVLNSILNNYGYRPICAPDAESGLEKLSHDASEARLVILDLNMPGMGGHKMLKELQRIAPNLPVIIASGHLPDGDIPSLIKAGKVDFVPKPFRWSELLKVVRRRLDGEPGSPS